MLRRTSDRTRAATRNGANIVRMIEPSDHADLKALAEIAPREQWATTQQLAQAIYDRDRAAGVPSMLSDADPVYFGLKQPLERMEAQGLIEMGDDAASSV